LDNVKIVGIDASQGMLDQAKEKALYTSLHKTLLCLPEEFKSNYPEFAQAFDFIGASGLLAEGHATNEVFDEMLFSLKTGGYAVFTCRVEYLTSLNYQKGMDERV
jgi:SAM-dependent methyltransferase